jgi:hypothetical protein
LGIIIDGLITPVIGIIRGTVDSVHIKFVVAAAEIKPNAVQPED